MQNTTELQHNKHLLSKTMKLWVRPPLIAIRTSVLPSSKIASSSSSSTWGQVGSHILLHSFWETRGMKSSWAENTRNPKMWRKHCSLSFTRSASGNKTHEDGAKGDSQGEVWSRPALVQVSHSLIHLLRISLSAFFGVFHIICKEICGEGRRERWQRGEERDGERESNLRS